MREAAAAGLPPHEFWGYSPREMDALLQGHGIRVKLESAMAEAQSWKTAYYGRVKKMPDLDVLMRKYRPKVKQSRKSLKATILAMAEAMGAVVVHRKKPPE